LCHAAVNQGVFECSALPLAIDNVSGSADMANNHDPATPWLTSEAIRGELAAKAHKML
jgi:hypothetical protein